jgi:UDPglucose 6-dehydrogenase
MRLLNAVQATNLSQRTHAVNCLRRLLGSLEGKTIAVWGATFKAGTGDLRDSPALDVVALLSNEGARVRIYDPVLAEEQSAGEAEVCASALDAVEDADALAVLTDWPEFATGDLADVAQRLRGRVLYDGRNHLSRTQVEAAGLVYYGVGRPSGRDSALAVLA